MTDNVSTGSVFDALIPQDIIKGWNDRRQSNTQVISGMMPFVQLIGIFDESEYEKMFQIIEDKANENGDNVSTVTDNFLNRRQVYYNDDTDALGSISSEGDGSADIMETIRTQLQERFINLYIAEAREADDNTYLSITPSNGILMAEAVPQTIDGTGGIGITDLQVENGINAFKTMTIRLTVNDPRILNTRPEYAKMSTLQGEFLIIYGWSNPSTVPGYDSTSPPIFETDPNQTERLMLRVPTGNMDTGGYWSAQRMNITGYDFSFNELGQMEVSLKLMGKTQMFLATTRMNTISNTWRKLMGTYDYEGDGAELGTFGTIKITKVDGSEVDLTEAALNEQRSYFEDLSSVAGFSLADVNIDNKSLDQALVELTAQSETLSESEQAERNRAIEASIKRRRERESLGYPYTPGISVTQKTIRQVRVDQAGDVNQEGEVDDAAGPDEESTGFKPITDYKSKIVYYYLGWVMDGIKLSISDRNRNSILSGERKIIPKFAYMSTTPDSNITSAFQSQIRRANSTETNQRIQDAVIRLKEKCMPPFISRRNKINSEIQRKINDGFDVTSEQYIPCRGLTLIDGIQTSATRDIADVLFPAPVGAPIGLPHRGFIRVVDFLTRDEDNDQDRELVRRLEEHDNKNNTSLLSIATDTSTFGEERGVHRFFIPDWYRYYDDNDNPTGGSLNGFDPTSPSDYMAADRGGKYYYLVSYTVTKTFRGTTQTENLQKIIEVDKYRQQNPEIWNLTQRKWYNLYTVYLGSYFERIIRERIGELQEEGREVEDIYDEPIDLDWLTGKQYRNYRFTEGNNNRFGGNEDETSIPDVANIQDMPVDEDLVAAIAQAEGRLSSLNEDIEPIQLALDDLGEQILEKVNQIKNLQSIETANVFDGDSAGIEQLTGGRYSRSPFDENGDLRENVTMGIDQLGFSGVSAVRARTNYGYGANPTQRDPAGNLIYSGFSNFLRNIQGSFDNNTNQYETFIELNNVEVDQYPTVTREYILYAFYGLRTDNFESIDGDGGGEQTNFINNSTAESILEDIGPERFFEDGLDLTGDGIVNFLDFFQLVDMGDDVGQYQEDRLTKIVEEFQGFVDDKVSRIERLNSELEPLYARYISYTSTLEAIESQKSSINIQLTEYSRYQTDTGLQAPLSLYDDTSDFDDVLEVPMGRAQPMRLTTKVAQQWYRMFDDVVQRGAGDVTNYGPAKGGTVYFPPSNTKTFRNNIAKQGKPIIGIPKIIFDPESYRDTIINNNPYTVSLNKDDPNMVNIPNLGMRFVNWQLFGNPAAPGSEESLGANSYGFKTGPRIERFDSEGKLVSVSGGNHVKDYQAFLDLFNVEVDPTLPGDYTIVGEWPDSGTDTPYHMIDDANNIIIPNDEGWYQQSGWYLENGGFPLYLYPGRQNATQIDPTKTTIAMPFGTPNGIYGFRNDQGEELVTSPPMGVNNLDDDATSRGQRNNLGVQIGRKNNSQSWTKNATTWKEPWNELHTVYEGRPLSNIGTPTEPILVDRLDTVPAGVDDDEADLTTYGCRIGRGEHCMNLTLDMKRALVINRKNFYFPDKDQDSKRTFYPLGDDNPTYAGGDPGSAGKYKINWSELVKKTTIGGEEKIFDYWVVKDDENAGTANMKPVYALAGSSRASIDAYEGDGDNLKPRRGASVVGREQDNTRVLKSKGYSNQYYPYGTGEYQQPIKQFGSAEFPEKSPNKNWLYIGDFLDRLPGRGFFTRINNRNNSPTILLPDGQIVDGEDLNIGFIQFVVRNVLAPLPKNRRIGSRSKDNVPRGPIQVINSKWIGDKDEWRIQDVTYGHLFRPEDDENEDLGDFSPQFADLSTFTIDNVADIPIRRDIIENLMNKQNGNMSIFQFMQQIMKPDAVGVDGKNINIGFRTRSDGVMEVFSPTKNWRNTARQAISEIDEAIFRNRYPEENLLLDYKKDDSLIERIDMNSKFDPGMTLTFELGARAFAGDPNKFAQFLSFGNIAVELRDFLIAEDPKFKGVLEIANDSAVGAAGRGTFDRNAFFANGTSDKPTVPASLVTSFLMQNPERMAKLNAMLVAESGGNFATQLLSNYMRKTTVTIHGTTNIFPNTTIHIRGVVPQLEGMYIVTNVRESVTPSGFQTILEGTLIENRNLDEVGEVN